VDHLDGILFIDHLSPLKRQLLLARYKKDHRGESVIKQLKATEARR
jgi:peptide deformylase